MKLKKGLECFAWVILAAVLILVNAAAANADEFSGQEYLAARKRRSSFFTVRNAEAYLFRPRCTPRSFADSIAAGRFYLSGQNSIDSKMRYGILKR